MFLARQPDAGEFVSIVGALYATGTRNEIGKYRYFFSWGSWANTTEGISVIPAVQVWILRVTVVVGDELGMDAEGKRVDATIVLMSPTTAMCLPLLGSTIFTFLFSNALLYN